MKRKPAAKAGVLIDVARVVSVGRNRSGEAALRFRGTKGRLVAVKLRRQQFRTLAKGVLGLAETLEGGRSPPIGGCASVSFHGRMMPRMMALRCRSAMARRASPRVPGVDLHWPRALAVEAGFCDGSQSDARLRLV